MKLGSAERKKCLQVSGGRQTYQAHYFMPGLEMEIFSRQSDHCLEGGGEVHYVSSCASGRITRMMVADICGSEDVFRRLSCEMRDGLIRSINSIWQNRVVEDVSRQFRRFADQGGFGTASVATYFAPTRSFVMCNIGNPPPLVYRAANRMWEVLHGDVLDDDTGTAPEDDASVDGVYDASEYRHIKTKLETDDLLVVYGNGFARSRFPDGIVAGHSRLSEALQEAPHSHPHARVTHLIRLIQGEKTPEEDSTVMVCRVTNEGVRLRDNLLAPLRLFRRPSDETSVN